MKSLIRHLRSRGMLENFSSGLDSVSAPTNAYLGFDPTAPSLHIGHWIGVCFLQYLKRQGVTPIALVGGATGMIGDPSGKNVERTLLQQETITENAQKITASLVKYLPEIQVVNNVDWLGSLSLVDFLRDVGKYFRVGMMLGKDSVKQRVHSEEGISYTEFSYLLLQSYDFAHLFKEYGVTLQCGGSDQWGNITSGIDFIRRLGLGQAYGLTYPLLTNRQGKKIGKTEAGTLWLDAEMTSPYVLYQYFLRLPDIEIPKIVRTLTFLDNEEIFELDHQLARDPLRAKQRVAGEIIASIHGMEALAEAQNLAENMYGEHHSEANFLELVSTGLGVSLTSAAIGKRWLDLLVDIGFAQSKGEVRRLIEQKGLYVNNVPLENEQGVLSLSDLCYGRYVLVAQGKKKKLVLDLQ